MLRCFNRSSQRWCLRLLCHISMLFVLAQPQVSTATTNVTATDLHCDIGACECYEDFVECHLKDCNDDGLRLNGFFNAEGPLLNNCETEVLTKHSAHFLSSQHVYIRKSVLSLKNCLQTPLSLRLEKLRYSMQLQLDRYIPHFSKSHNLWELTPTGDVHNGWLPVQLVLHLDVITYMQLSIVCTAATVTVPQQLFQALHTLEELVLHVGRGAQGYPTTLNTLTAAHFRDLSKLTMLELDGNRMQTLEADIFMSLTALQRLNLSLNALHSLPAKLLAAQQQLISIDLSGNALETLPRGLFNSTVLLAILNLAHNRLCVPTNLIVSLRMLYNLHKLDLSYNRFESLRGTGVYENTTLLAVPHFERAASVTPPLTALNITINLSNNRITHFSFDWVEHLRDCFYSYDLTHNNIAHAPLLVPPLVRASHCARQWRLSHNPLQCDCQLAWLTKNEYQFDTADWLCDTPTQLSAQQPHALSSTAVCSWTPNWCPNKCACNYDTAVLTVNCTGAQLLALPTLPRPEQVGLRQTTLHLNNNNVSVLPANTTFGYANVSAIYAAHNRLASILPYQLPHNLIVLDLRFNNLTRLSNDFLRVYLNESETLQQLYLSDNPWLCDCATELLLNVVRTQSARIPDAAELLCANLPNVTLSSVNYELICAPRTQPNALLNILLVLALLLIAFISAIALFYKYNLHVQIWLYAHHVFLCPLEDQELDKRKTFDAFISYAHQQQHYVNKILLPGLEHGVPSFRICTHERNWLAGAYIPEQIVESVEQSRRTIIVLSQHFIESDWSRMEFRMAHQCALNEGRTRIIIIKYGELKDMERMDKEMQVYLKMNTYLEWDDARFWQKLRYAMPHRGAEVRRAGMLAVPRRAHLPAEQELNWLS